MMELGLMAALLAGLLGAGHCLTMCGAIAAGPGIASRAGCSSCAGGWRHALLPRLAYNGGRVASYVFAGALAGAVGGGLGYSADQLAQLVVSGLPAGLALRAVSAILLILVGLRLMLRWHWLSWPERAALEAMRRVAPNLLQRLESGPAAGGRGLHRHAALGLLWGWLPCGQSYSMLLVAAASASAGSGALMMLAFGLGTLPAMLGVGIAGGVAGSLRKASPMAMATGWVMVALGSAVLASTSAPLLARGTDHTAEHQQHLLHPPAGLPGSTPLAGPMWCHPPETMAP